MPLGTHTSPCARTLRLVRTRAGRYVAMRIPLTRVPLRPLSCVVRRRLYLEENQIAALPALVFNGLTNLQ